jgi:hemoglobin-like flavoprotein
MREMNMLASSPAPAPSLIAAVENQAAGGDSSSNVADLVVQPPPRRSRSLSPMTPLHVEKNDDEDEIRYSRHRQRAHAAAGHKREQDDLMLDRRKRVVRTSWRAVQFGLDVKACQIFYNRLFDQQPAVRSMFPDNMKAQYHKLYAAVSLAVQVLDEPDALLPVLQDLGRQHAKYGVVREHYEYVIECFLWTLNSYIVSKMPHNNAVNWMYDVMDAWDWVLTFIGKTMADAADEEMARTKDEEEARLAVEEALRLSKSVDS